MRRARALAGALALMATLTAGSAPAARAAGCDNPIGRIVGGLTGQCPNGGSNQGGDNGGHGGGGHHGGGGGGGDHGGGGGSEKPAPAVVIAPALQLSVFPRAARVHRRTRFTLTAFTYEGARRRLVGGATVRFAGRTLATNGLGRAVVTATFPRAGFVQASASAPGLRDAATLVEVLGPLPRVGEEPGERPCISGRYTVKNASDPHVGAIDPRPVPIPLTALWLLRPPRALHFGTPRLPGIERHVYQMQVRLVSVQLEPDLDIHLVVAAPGHPRRTMITELPSPRCYTVAISPYRNQMVAARAALYRACGRIGRAQRRVVGLATVTGVGFWDSRHGQFGVARNGMELHPVLGLQTSGCRTAHVVRHGPPRRQAEPD